MSRLKKTKFDEDPSKSLLVTDDDFREYFLGVLSMSAFVMGQLRYNSLNQRKPQNQDSDEIPMFSTTSSEDEGSSSGEVAVVEEVEAPEPVAMVVPGSTEQKKSKSSSSSGEIAVTEDVEEFEVHVAEVQGGVATVRMDEQASPAAEVYVAKVKGMLTFSIFVSISSFLQFFDFSFDFWPGFGLIFLEDFGAGLLHFLPLIQQALKNLLLFIYLILIFMLLDTWADPLQHVVAEVFVLLLHGLVKLYKEVEASGQSLYEKYKNMREGAHTIFGFSKFGKVYLQTAPLMTC